jgi:gamma-glutamyltranspeptidase/glutathione hydrolase
MSTHGVVCSAHPLASLTGSRILARGGNFMDAALATSAVLNVVEPYNSHLGGDAFMLIHSGSDDHPTAINASGPAPADSAIEEFPEGMGLRGIRMTSVPGQVGAWILAQERYATMDWPDLIRPALGYARDGFPANPRLASAVRGSAGELGVDDAWRDVFLPGGSPPEVGDIFVQKDLSRTLETIAEDPSEFYNGRVGEEIASFSKRSGGLLTEEDLGGYEAEALDPIHTSYRGFDVYEQPPVSQGHILLEELNIVEGYDLSALSPDGPEAVHLMVEAKKLAFADRQGYSGDPRFVDIPLDEMLSKEHATSRRRLIDPQRALAGYSPGELVGGDTTYFAVADGQGNAVSFIQSLFHGFGSGVVVPGTGILLNNRMRGFSLNPSHPNALQPGKRTMHTLNTYMVYNEGSPLLVGGTPGGDKQVQTNLQVITRLLDWGMNVQEAAEYPRWASGEGVELSAESRYPRKTLDTLSSRGHDIRDAGPWGTGGAVQLILIHPHSGALIGGSDPRCDGCAIGA